MKELADKKPKSARINIWYYIEALEGIAIMIACYFTIFLKPWRDRWGMTKDQLDREFPGDHIVPDPRSEFTHGIDIDAPADFVWPWIVQMGKDRGGFYSYELLENLVGLKIYNSDEILTEYQRTKVGDMIPFGPETAYPLVICEPGSAMVIENHDDLDARKSYDPEQGHPDNFLHLTWLWFIEPVGNRRSRFISRNRLNYKSSLKNRMTIGLLAEPIVFAMDRKMCLGIKKRAEQYFRASHRKKAPVPADLG